MTEHKTRMTTENLADAVGDASPPTTAQLAARDYIGRGWRIVPVSRESKRPYHTDWPKRTFGAGDIGQHDNVGVVLGHVSGHLTDIDLDSTAAIELAPHFLEETVTFGRESKRRSHWLYICEGVHSCKRSFSVENEGKRGTELVEIRAMNARNDDCGHQSVFPGSTHESGEHVEWDNEQASEITAVERGDLIWRVTRLTVASIIAQDWRPGTQRNAKAMGLAGGLLKMGWASDEVIELFEAIFDVCGVDDDQREKDLGAIERTVASYESGAVVTGFGSLIEGGILEKWCAADIERHARTPSAIALELKLAGTAAGSKRRHRLVRERQETDGLVAAEDKFLASMTSAESPTAANDTGPAQTDALAALGEDPGLDAACDDLDWLIAELQLAPGKVSLLTSFAGGGKTPMAGLISVCVAAGVPCLDHAVKRVKVLYLATEGGRNARRKIIRIALGLGVDARKLVADGWLKIVDAKALNDDTLAHLESVIVAREIGLVIIDTITSALRDSDAGRNEAEYAHTLWQLGPISERTRCVVLGLAHDNKSATGSDLRGTSGSSAIVEAAATVIRLEPSPEDDKLIRVLCARAPDDRFPPFGIRWVDGDGTGSIGASARGNASARGSASVKLRCVLDEGAMTDRRGANSTNVARATEKALQMQASAPRVLDALKNGAGGACKLSELAEAAGDLSKRALLEVLARLKKENAIDGAAGFYKLKLGWRNWPTPALQGRVQLIMAAKTDGPSNPTHRAHPPES